MKERTSPGQVERKPDKIFFLVSYKVGNGAVFSTAEELGLQADSMIAHWSERYGVGR